MKLLFGLVASSLLFSLSLPAQAFNFTRDDVIDNIPANNSGNTFYPGLSQSDPNTLVWKELRYQYIEAPYDIVPGTYPYYEARVIVKDPTFIYPTEWHLRPFWEQIQSYPLPALNTFTAPDGRLTRLKFTLSGWEGTVAFQSYHPCFYNSYNSLLIYSSRSGSGDNYVDDVNKATCGHPNEINEIYGSIPDNSYASIRQRVGTGASIAFTIRSNTLPPDPVGEGVGEYLGFIQFYQETQRPVINMNTGQFGPMQTIKFIDSPGRVGNFNSRPRDPAENGIMYEQLAVPLWKNYYLTKNPISTSYPRTRAAYFDHPTQGSFSSENKADVNVTLYTFPVRVRNVLETLQSCQPGCINVTRQIRELEVFQGFYTGYEQQIYKFDKQSYSEDDLFPYSGGPGTGGTVSTGNTCPSGSVVAPWSTPTSLYCIPGQGPTASASDISVLTINDNNVQAVPEPSTVFGVFAASSVMMQLKRHYGNRKKDAVNDKNVA